MLLLSLESSLSNNFTLHLFSLQDAEQSDSPVRYLEDDMQLGEGFFVTLVIRD